MYSAGTCLPRIPSRRTSSIGWPGTDEYAMTKPCGSITDTAPPTAVAVASANAERSAVLTDSQYFHAWCRYRATVRLSPRNSAISSPRHVTDTSYRPFRPNRARSTASATNTSPAFVGRR